MSIRRRALKRGRYLAESFNERTEIYRAFQKLEDIYNGNFGDPFERGCRAKQKLKEAIETLRPHAEAPF